MTCTGELDEPRSYYSAYDQQTQKLTGQQVAIGSTTAVAGAYDNAGDVLSDTDTPSAGSA